MSKINTHGYKMIGIKAACSSTKGINPRACVQISYDMVTGDVLTNYHIGDSSWSDYRDPDVITICFTRRYMTMQELSDAIADSIRRHDLIASMYR